jgi:hypothetical protein
MGVAAAQIRFAFEATAGTKSAYGERSDSVGAGDLRCRDLARLSRHHRFGVAIGATAECINSVLPVAGQASASAPAKSEGVEGHCLGPVAEWSRRTYPAPLGAGGVGSIPANSDAQNVPSFRRW